MTVERKQELRQLLNEAKRSLAIRYKYGGPISIPVDVYSRYLQERWTYYGIDFSSFAFSINIADGTTESNLLDFIREELFQFIDGQDISVGSYRIDTDSTDESSRLYFLGREGNQLWCLLEDLLEISLVQGIEGAVSFFDRCSRPEGTHAFLRNVGFLEGVKIEAEVEVFDGVRLVPLPSSEIVREMEQHLSRVSPFPIHTFTNRRTDSLFGKTLLVIDHSAFCKIHRPSETTFQDGTRIDDLPFQVKVHKVKFPNEDAVDSFQTLFCQSLSLVCNSPANIFIGFYALEEDKSFGRHLRRPGISKPSEPRKTEMKEADIEQAKCLYKRLVDLEANDRERLQIPIDRWIMSKTNRSHIDKIIDLGIAFEALYVPDGGGDLTYKFSIRAARHLGKDKEHRKELLQKFKQIYNCRSDAVHSGKLDKPPKFGKGRIPVSDFIERAQDLCRKSIIKILEDGEIPDWDSLILSGEV